MKVNMNHIKYLRADIVALAARIALLEKLNQA